MKPFAEFRRPVLARHARYRWDRVRQQHQLVFPEGILVLNNSAAAIVQLCDGRAIGELVAALETQFETGRPADDLLDFLKRLATKGLLDDAANT